MRQYPYLDVKDNDNYYVRRVNENHPMYGLIDALKWLEDNDYKSINWWRGHSKTCWTLVPFVYRKPFVNNPHVEKPLVGNFRLEAKVRSEGKCPDYDDYFSWLTLAQHYGIPTRLLDWTRSFALAVYFAVYEEENKDKDGAVWGLEPRRLNNTQVKEEDFHRLFLPEDDRIEHLSKEVFKTASKKKRRDLGLESIDDIVLAVVFQHFDLRHMIQDSVFTIHGTKKPLEDLLGAKKFLVKIEIPSKAKKKIEKMLSQSGFKESFVYPDLEHFAIETKRKWEEEPKKDCCKLQEESIVKRTKGIVSEVKDFVKEIAKEKYNV